MTTLIFGASAGIGRALARELAAAGHRLVLVARSARDLEAEAAHLRTAFDAAVDWLPIDASRPHEVVKALEAAAEGLNIQNLLFPVGMAAADDDGLLAVEKVVPIINANLTSVIAVVGIFLPQMIRANGGNVVGFGSVAAVRGRGANVVYAAAKRGLESYFESIRHQTAMSGVHVQFYRLGYVHTQLSYGRKMLFPVANPEAVAKRVVRNLDRDIGLVYFPRFWAAIAFVLRALPWVVFRRLQF
jgi:short-subunit dehydrogenase